jgi:hypothetical protein
MKTAESIEQQEDRKSAKGAPLKNNKKDPNYDSHNTVPVSDGRRRQLAALKPWPKGVSGNPGGRPKVDLAAEIARALFQNDGPAIYAAYSKMLRKGSAYAFQVLADRAFGKLKESIQHEISPYHDVSDADLVSRIAELERELGISSSAPEPPPASETKPN